jgi:uncharacterized membrane protein YhiD involved in acid resistance
VRRKDWGTILLVALLSAMLGFGLVLYILSDKSPAGSPSQNQNTAATPTSQSRQDASANQNTQGEQQAQASSSSSSNGGDSFISRIFGNGQSLPGQTKVETWDVIIPRIIARLLLATLLAAILAFRPRKDSPIHQRNLYVAQTQILLAVVASALMMIVGDNAARAFGIFAAVSLVRFRTNIRDPKEITVLLISLSLGLATGVGRWDLAVILCLFVLTLLRLLESREQEQVFRSMQLTVRTYNTDAMQNTLKAVFQHHKLNAELRQLDPPDEKEPMGCIMYYVNMNLTVSTDRISEEIRMLDPKNVDSIEWEQKKDSSYIYQ